VEPLELLADHVAAVLEPMLDSIRGVDVPINSIRAKSSTLG
jgi:hypothetical protein